MFLTLNVNTVFANLLPEEVAAACGENSCVVLFKKINKFAKNGIPHAQAVLALLYRGGYGTEVNNELSLKYMKRTAKNSLSLAQYDLGIMYKLGFTVKEDQVKSEEWLKRSAKAGYNRLLNYCAVKIKYQKRKM